jgi:hypothetical protein
MPEAANDQHPSERPDVTLGAPKQLAAQRVPIALESLLISIDQCRFILNNVETRNASTRLASQRYQPLMSSRDQKELDRAIEAFWEDLRVETDSELDRLARENLAESLEETKPIYPLAAEIFAVISGIVFKKVGDDVSRKHFGRYEEDPIKAGYIHSRTRLGPAGRIESVAGAAILPLIVSKVEEFLAALLRTGVTLHRNSLGVLPSIPDEIYQRYRANISSSDIERWQIDQKVAAVIKGPPSEWQKTVLQWTKIDVSELGANWTMLIEMIQRRHAVVHNGGHVDADYMRNVPAILTRGLQIGSLLVTDTTYIKPVLIELETWAICLAMRWGKHFFKESASYYPLILDRVTDLEDVGRWSQALAICDALLHSPLPTDTRLVTLTRINHWFCLQEIGKDDENLRREIADSEDDPEDHYVPIGQFALLRQYDKLLQALRTATDDPTGAVPKAYLREMPLIKRAMRESPKVNIFLLSAGRPPSPPSQHRGRGKRPHRR